MRPLKHYKRRQPNPDDNFRFNGEHYIFNINTTGLVTGTYRMLIKAGDDPTTHTVSFQIR